MPRVKRGTVKRRRHNKVLKSTKGYRGRLSELFRAAKRAATKAGQHAYRHRRLKKRDFRGLWIARLSAAVKTHDMNYSRFINALARKKIALDRKVLSDIAINEPKVFEEIVKAVR